MVAAESTGFEWRERDGVSWLAWEAGGVTAAFPARFGGVSAPPLDSLNLGLSVNDEPENVLENRRRCAPRSACPQDRLVVPGQVHGTTLAWVGEAEAGRGACDSPSVIREHDGLLTRAANLGLVISYADCVPVVIVADGEEGPAFATVHAGWRGMIAGIAGMAAAELAKGRRLRRRRGGAEHRPLLLRGGRGAAAPVRGPVPGIGRRRDRRPLALRAAGPRGCRGAGRSDLRRRPLHGLGRPLLLAPARRRGDRAASGGSMAAGSIGRLQK